jgi:F0F1-type ATP synthase assembly protein I
VSRSYHEELGKAVAADAEAIGFFTSILAGLLIGLGVDAWLGTGPAFTISGIVLGSVSGFWKLWSIAKRETEREQANAG